MERESLYYEGMAIREDGKNIWIFEVDDKFYKNNLKACLDYKCENVYPGMRFEINEKMLDASKSYNI